MKLTKHCFKRRGGQRERMEIVWGRTCSGTLYTSMELSQLNSLVILIYDHSKII
jgi:hypothetical protein